MRSIVRSWMSRRGLGLVLAAVLTACGGGGGDGAPAPIGATPASATPGSATAGTAAAASGDGTARTADAGVSVDASARLFRPSAIVPRIPELEGRSATCTLASGALPAGMTLNTDCTITGTPTQAGSFPMVVRASVEGLSGLFERPASVLVSGPSLTYIMPSAIAAGSGVDLPTLNNFWSAGPADFVTYSVQGALPPGLAVDARTGRIHGTATTLGSYEFTLSVRTENAGRVFTQVQALSNRMEVRPARVFYNASQAWVGLPFTTSPVLPDGTANFRYAVSGLPEGLSMDPQTGVVSGIARAPQPFPSTVPRQFSRRVTVNVTITLNGLTFVDPLDVSL